MDPASDSEWHTCKNESYEESPGKGNIARSWQWREIGMDPPHSPSNKTVLENIAEDILVQKPLKIKCCDLPGYPRSTFLMVFSPDGTKVASTHGNHNVYVSELASGKHVRILKGHPRTPWCIAFHPSHPELIGSGCLGGQVRVWDISSGGSEVWNVRNETVIASIAFHPREQLLVIATFNELYFWDWSQPAPFTKVSTNSVNEKVRYVAFDALGYKLITGISLWSSMANLIQQNASTPPTNNQSSNRRTDGDASNNNNRPQESPPGSAQDMIVNSYQNLVQRYDSLVRNYQRLFMVGHRLTNTPPPPSTIDRGTDPMESDLLSSPLSLNRQRTSATWHDDANPQPSTSRRHDGSEGDAEGSRSSPLNVDPLSFDTSSASTQESPQQDQPVFGSRSSAFQPLSEMIRRPFRNLDHHERSTRLLPNPFSSNSASISRSPRTIFHDGNQQATDYTSHTSRTSIFTSSRPEFVTRDFLMRRRYSSVLQRTLNSNLSANDITSTRNNLNSDSNAEALRSMPSTSNEYLSQRPRMTNSSTQISPASTPVDAQNINDSLDLIRDILRDSGTRLLNLITNMSLSTLASVERNAPRRAAASHTHSEDGESTSRPRGSQPNVRFIDPSLIRDFLSSSSDSDSDQSLEVNIFRTRNSTFREDSRDNERPTTSSSSRVQPTDRMVFELDNNLQNETNDDESSNVNVTLSNSRFRVRTQSNSAGENSNTSVRNDESSPGSRPQSTPNLDRPSTSRDNFWMGNDSLPPDEAYRKVRNGVAALQKHTALLTDMWLRGYRTTMRELRVMWDNLRRRIWVLYRETDRQGVPSYYTRSLLERCRILTEMSDNISRTTTRPSRTSNRTEASGRNANDSQSSHNQDTAQSNRDREERSSTTSVEDTRPPLSGRSPHIRLGYIRTSFNSTLFRKRLQSSYRWRAEDEYRRRSRNPIGNRLSQRYSSRFRRDCARSVEISATRHEIRMRAMQVLSFMFNMMMMCLEQRGLSQVIITMLRTLKKALALTCLMLMTNRNIGQSNTNPMPAAQRVESLNVIRIQNVDDAGPINVDDPDESNVTQNSTADFREMGINNMHETEDESPRNETIDNTTVSEPPYTSQALPDISHGGESNSNPSPSNLGSKWSDRLAVQIAAANRNHSLTARNRRDIYLEGRRLKALHRTNPTAHPLIRKRAVPPVSPHRIPALRSIPNKINISRLRTPRNRSPNEEPIAGPSNAFPSGENNNQESSRSSTVMNEFEHRVNLIRLAHMQAVRLRNDARNRFRRLQTIRLYTPSSLRMREMFIQYNNNSDNQSGNRVPLPEVPEMNWSRRPIPRYRTIPLPLSANSNSNNRSSDEPHNFQPVLNEAGAPQPQANVSPSNAEPSVSHPQRLPRIHEYLQPIILAQNAMVVDEDGNGGDGGGPIGGPGSGSGGIFGSPMGRVGGMAGLLDAGIISEALPNPSHRVQAWDFTKGDTPDIADSAKNVVVNRCRIHNDASIDISKDGRLLVALLPVPRLRNANHWLGVYSLEWARLGQCLHTAVLEQSAVSVALSPTARHLAVGLGSRRFSTTVHTRTNVFALLYRLDPLESSSRTGLSPIKELEQNWEPGFTSLNCLRWAPQPGQGLVYANNTGQLIVMS